MKVLHLISGGDTGGAKTHVFALLSALVNKIDVKMVCFSKGVFYDELSKMPVDSELIEQKGRTDMSVLERLIEIIDEGFDIVHCHGARANFIAVALKKRGIKIPFITTVHSDYLLDFDGFYKKLLYTSLNVYSLKKFDYYIAVSSNFKDMLISRNFRPNSVFTVYNGMDYSSKMEYCSREEFASRIGIEYDPETTYVGIIGRHDFVKGHDVFLKAAQLVSDRIDKVKFVIAGDGEGRAELVKLCESLGISDRVIFAGFIKDIYSFINFIDINTLTSRCESFPYVLMEGARLKKPTVSSRVGGIPDLIIDGECGFLFEKENHNDLADKLIKLIEDKNLANTFGENLYNRATGNFSNEKLALSHVEIYNSVISDYYSDKKYDVCLSGYYGFKNCGDDALLHAIINDLRQEKPDIRINVFSMKPKITKRNYGVDSSFRFNYFSLVKKLKQTNLLINGGGSLIQDATSSKSLWYYLNVIKLAKKLGCKVYIYANGIGPVKDKNLKFASEATNLADFITLREKSSLSEIERMGIAKDKVMVTADPAISLSGSPDKVVENILKKTGIDRKKSIIGVSVRDWMKNDAEFFAKLGGYLDELVNDGYEILFIPMKIPDDEKASLKVMSYMKNKAYMTPSGLDYTETIGVISKTYIMIGMRLHTLIFSVASGVPVVGIVYDPKITGFLEYANIDKSVNAEDFDVELLKKYTRDIIENYSDVKIAVEDNSKTLSEKAKLSAKICIKLLNGEEI